MPCRAYAYTAMENRCIADDAADGCFPLQNTMQKGILTLRRGVIRCVGVRAPAQVHWSANSSALPLFCFRIHSISYVHAHIKSYFNIFGFFLIDAFEQIYYT